MFLHVLAACELTMMLLVPKGATLKLPTLSLHSAEDSPITEPHKELRLGSPHAAQRCQAAWARRNTAERGRAGNWRVSTPSASRGQMHSSSLQRPAAQRSRDAARQLGSPHGISHVDGAQSHLPAAKMLPSAALLMVGMLVIRLNPHPRS